MAASPDLRGGYRARSEMDTRRARRGNIGFSRNLPPSVRVQRAYWLSLRITCPRTRAKYATCFPVFSVSLRPPPSTHGIRYPRFPLPENSRCTAFASRPSPEIGKQRHSRAKNVSLASDDSFDRKDIKSRRGEANEKSKEEGGSLRLRVKFKGRYRQFRCFSNPICVKSSVKGSPIESFIWRNQYTYIYI